MKKISLSLVTGLFLAAVQAEERNISKPFGLGVGPSYIGGRDTDGQVALKIYQQFIMYRRLMGMNTEDDEQYYARWTNRDECIGSCPRYSHCKKGICLCTPEDSAVQVYGRCFANLTANSVGDEDKYRKPTPPPRPENCFCKDENGGMDVCPENRRREECQVVTYPNNFDHNTQYCRRGDHDYCLGKDINMFCSRNTDWDQTTGQVKPLCQCRKDMKFDTRNMECRVFIDVDCSHETASGYQEGEVARVLQGMEEPTREYTQTEIKTAFCNLIDVQRPVIPENVVQPKSETYLEILENYWDQLWQFLQ